MRQMLNLLDKNIFRECLRMVIGVENKHLIDWCIHTASVAIYATQFIAATRLYIRVE